MEVHDQHSDQIQTLTNGAEKGRLDKGKLLSLTLSPTSVSSFLKDLSDSNKISLNIINMDLYTI